MGQTVGVCYRTAFVHPGASQYHQEPYDYGGHGFLETPCGVLSRSGLLTRHIANSALFYQSGQKFLNRVGDSSV